MMTTDKEGLSLEHDAELNKDCLCSYCLRASRDAERNVI